MGFKDGFKEGLAVDGFKDGEDEAVGFKDGFKEGLAVDGFKDGEDEAVGFKDGFTDGLNDDGNGDGYSDGFVVIVGSFVGVLVVGFAVGFRLVVGRAVRSGEGFKVGLRVKEVVGILIGFEGNLVVGLREGATDSILVAAERPDSYAPCTVDKYALEVCSPAKNTLLLLIPMAKVSKVVGDFAPYPVAPTPK